MFLLEKNDVLREKFRTVLKKFIYQSAEIYGGEKGLYDYGHNGDSMMDNIKSIWKVFFVVEEKMLKVKCTMLTPEKVLKASGHVDRFTDFLVKDEITNESYRADHLIEKYLEELMKDKTLSEEKLKEISDIIQQIDNYGEKGLGDLIKKFDIKSPTNNSISEPKPFNLMFATSIGPSGDVKGYLRPETAQGIFINFKNFLEEKHNKLPFAVSQIGSSFRNEIAPRAGLLRVREFEMAEIEHFLDPLDKRHPKFPSVAGLNIFMFPSEDQISGKAASLINLGDAVARKLVANETLGYFIGRIYLFLTKVGVKHELLRFRQHMPNEMAHYASDCWDAECRTSYGWIECVGCADRSCYDLQCHSACSGTELVAQRQLKEPRLEKRVTFKPNMKELGTTFRKNANVVANYLKSLPTGEAREMLDSEKMYNIDGVDYPLKSTMGDCVEENVTIHTESFVPSVIEPSFGLGRIFYSIMEQNFSARSDDPERTYFTVPSEVAAYQFSILPLSANAAFVPLTSAIERLLQDLGIMFVVDDSSASIGKRYARTDQIGVPFGITVDFNSVNLVPASVTVRERDSMSQIRVEVDSLSELARDLVRGGQEAWVAATRKYPAFEGQI